MDISVIPVARSDVVVVTCSHYRSSDSEEFGATVTKNAVSQPASAFHACIVI